MRLISNGSRSLELRSVRATHDTETHGQYRIGEIAYIDEVEDTPYVTSFGVSFRQDNMSSDVVKVREERDKSKKWHLAG